MLDALEILPRLSKLRQSRARIIESAGAQKIVNFRSAWGILDKKGRAWEAPRNGNRVIDLGADGTCDVSDLPTPFSQAGLPRFFVYLDPYSGVERTRESLKAAGLKKCMDVIVSARALEGFTSHQPKTGLTVKVASEADTDDIFQVLTYHQTQPPLWEDKVRGSLHEEGANVHLAYWEGVPISVAVLNVSDGLAFLSNATTVPEFRGRGAQQALIGSRLGFARDKKCDIAIVESHHSFADSVHNLHSAGFEHLYDREVFRFEFDSGIRDRLTDATDGHQVPTETGS